MLKSLGATMAQVTQRLRQGDAPSASGLYGRAQRVARRAERRRQLKTIIVLFVVFVVMVGAFSSVFHELMAREDRSFSWPSSVYWTLTTMTTLGFGDITFESDAGRIFSVIVLLSGSLFLLVMLPFVFIQFVFIPWMNERERRRAPRTLPASTSGHLILTALGSIEEALIDRADQAEVPYVVIVEDVDDAGRLHDEGRTVMVGELDDPRTYHNARVGQAAGVVTTQNDQTNTNIAFTVREIAPQVDIVASANSPASVDILEIAGADHIVQLGEVLGAAMAARALGLGGQSHMIGSFAGLQIAEAGSVGTDLVDRTLAESRLRARFGVGIIGVWDRGEFTVASADTKLRDSSMLLLAGTSDQLAAFDQRVRHRLAEREERRDHRWRARRPRGRAGLRRRGHRLRDRRATTRTAAGGRAVRDRRRRRPPGARAGRDQRRRRGADHHPRRQRQRVPDPLLPRAAARRADRVPVAAGPQRVDVVSRRRRRRSVLRRHRVGGNLEPLPRRRDVARRSRAQPVPYAHPRELAGTTLAESHVYRRTQCNVVAVEADGLIRGNPDANVPLPADGELVLVGTDIAEARFSEVFPRARHRPGSFSRRSV